MKKIRNFSRKFYSGTIAFLYPHLYPILIKWAVKYKFDFAKGMANHFRHIAKSLGLYGHKEISEGETKNTVSKIDDMLADAETQSVKLYGLLSSRPNDCDPNTPLSFVVAKTLDANKHNSPQTAKSLFWTTTQSNGNIIELEIKAYFDFAKFIIYFSHQFFFKSAQGSVLEYRGTSAGFYEKYFPGAIPFSSDPLLSFQVTPGCAIDFTWEFGMP